jgi:hypothetical protein
MEAAAEEEGGEGVDEWTSACMDVCRVRWKSETRWLREAGREGGGVEGPPRERVETIAAEGAALRRPTLLEGTYADDR